MNLNSWFTICHKNQGRRRRRILLPRAVGVSQTFDFTDCRKMSETNADKDNHAPNNKGISLPISRVRLIMKSSPDVSNINQDALFLTTKATELFVQNLALSSFNNGSGKETKTLSYSDLANTAEKTETFHFLTDILPKKILARDYLKSLEQMQEEETDN
ncbi:chromatin accessibility complex protein 1 [Polymixia lowei]